MRLTLSTFFILLLAVLAVADMGAIPLGATIKGFVYPQRNAEGELTANITGDTAKAVSLNRTEITGLKIDIYEGKQVSTVITSPKSDLWNDENRLSTRSGVIIKRGDMEISSQSMEWELKDQKAILRQQVKVVIDKFSFGAPIQTP